MKDWLFARLREIRVERLRPKGALRDHPSARPGTLVQTKPRADRRPVAYRAIGPDVISPSPVADLPRLEARFDITFELSSPETIETSGIPTARDARAFRLRGELVRLSLFEGFDELLCLPALRGVEAYRYHIETVRKVLKQYRGGVCWPMRSGSARPLKPGWC
jgi:hypothetical protein